MYSESPDKHGLYEVMRKIRCLFNGTNYFLFYTVSGVNTIFRWVHLDFVNIITCNFCFPMGLYDPTPQGIAVTSEPIPFFCCSRTMLSWSLCILKLQSASLLEGTSLAALI